MAEHVTQPYIDARGVHFVYESDYGEATAIEAVRGIDLSIEKGQHLAILGRNGSGKSTLAKLLNALEIPSEGVVRIAGFETDDERHLWEIRQRCGMVFQNPDNQIVGTTVEEDVAFGPENLGVPHPELRNRVNNALASVKMSEYATRQPSELSGGQKQKLAIAGILAMEPECVILDEATAMLDPMTRRDLMQLIRTLQSTYGLTIINVTHHMDEALVADQLIILDRGKVILKGAPYEVFAHVDAVEALGLEVPVPTAFAYHLAEAITRPMPRVAGDGVEGAIEAIKLLLQDIPSGAQLRILDQDGGSSVDHGYEASPGSHSRDALIEVKGLAFTYNAGETHEVHALSDINFDVRKGEVLGVIGSSGSGKSTLIQHLNMLTKPQQGSVFVNQLSTSEHANLKVIREKVGLLFQYPEHQLFAETIFDDVAFGPRQQKRSASEVKEAVEAALAIVGLADLDSRRSPFELSGGQMRRVALAGILAMKPDVLILDEPAAGLDPVGKKEILDYIETLRSGGVTVVLVSHSMDDVARYADRLLVLHEGRQIAWGDKAAVFSNQDALREVQLELPQVTQFMMRLSEEVLPSLMNYPPVYTIEEAVRLVIKAKSEMPGGGHE